MARCSPSPEATRRRELMADAFSTYHLGHARGASNNVAGDCDFDSNGPHGTLNQRRAATEWGAEVAQDRPRGKINSAVEMVALFDAQLPVIVAPDAP